MMSNRDKGWIASIAISISESSDLPRLGMSGRHVTRAMETMATYLNCRRAAAPSRHAT